MEYFLSVFASLAPLFASLACSLGVAVITFCAICAICATPASYAHARTYAHAHTRTHTCTFYTKMTQMTQKDMQVLDNIAKSFCVTFDGVTQVAQKALFSLEKRGFSWI